MRQKLWLKAGKATGETLNFRAFINLLNSSAQLKYFRFIVIHSLLSLIEVVSVMCIAFLGLRSLTIFSNEVNSRKDPFSMDLNVASFSFTLGAREVFVLFGFFLILLVLKNFLALFLYYRLSGFLADLGESLSLSLFKKLLNVSPLHKKNLDRSETSAALTDSIYSGVLQVLGQFVLLFSETVLMILMFMGLLVYEPIITLILLFLAGIVFMFSFSRIRNITFAASKNTAVINAHSKNLVQESMNFAEVIYFQNRGHFFIQNFLKDLTVRGSNFKKLQTSQQSPKYFLDIIFLSCILLFAVFET
jgi:ABC-type bacteriocin/lantibiotic exporter with double-glycine peptidase domain